MSYGYFAEFYDSFTDDVNYDKIEKFVCSLLSREGIYGVLLLDRAFGSGALAVRLSEKGYSVIGTDMSPEMLSVAQQKAAVKNADILFLCQDMTQLNLYGTIICTVCTLDSLNHLKSLDEIKKVFSLVSLFTEEGGIFVFDVNTLYKHKKVLGNNAFIYENGDALCAWQNSLDGDTVNIELDFFAETLVAQHLFQIVTVVFPTFIGKRCFVHVFLNLERQQVFVCLVAAPRVDVGMVVFLYQPLEPVAVHTAVVFLGDKVRNLLDVPVEVHPLFLRDQCHTGLVALFLRAPVVGVDGKLACRLDVRSADVPDTEIDTCQIRHVVLGRCFSDECRHFHIYVLLSLSSLPFCVSCHHQSFDNV